MRPAPPASRVLVVVLLVLGLGAVAWLLPTSADPPAPARPEPAPENARGAEMAGVSVTSDPAPALVFVDGEFSGETAPGRALSIVARPGTVQVRLSEAGRLDAVFDALLERDVVRSFHVILSGPDGPWTAIETPIRLAVGQPVRGRLEAGTAGGVGTVRYVIDETLPPHRLLTLVNGTIGCRVLGPEGDEIALQRLEKAVDGSPGRAFFEYRAACAGRYQLEVSGNRGPYSFRFAQGLPALATTDRPGHRGRREPPKPPGD